MDRAKGYAKVQAGTVRSSFNSDRFPSMKSPDNMPFRDFVVSSSEMKKRSLWARRLYGGKTLGRGLESLGLLDGLCLFE